MERKISFHNMDHSDPLEQHAQQKLDKLEEFLDNEQTPLYIELRLTSNSLHPHHHVELHLKTPLFNLNTHDEGTDMYVMVDNTIDKMVSLVKKEKAKIKDKEQKTSNEKGEFASDKYPLSD